MEKTIATNRRGDVTAELVEVQGVSAKNRYKTVYRWSQKSHGLFDKASDEWITRKAAIAAVQKHGWEVKLLGQGGK